MKKLIGTLGVIVFAMAMFLNTNTVNSTHENIDLANLVSISNANAEIMCPDYENGGYTQAGNGVSSDCFNTTCVCKNGVCSEANWISFRTECGSTDSQDPSANTNENCAAQPGASGC